MTRMTGPDCVVMCNLINTYIHTYILHTYYAPLPEIDDPDTCPNHCVFAPMHSNSNDVFTSGDLSVEITRLQDEVALCRQRIASYSNEIRRMRAAMGRHERFRFELAEGFEAEKDKANLDWRRALGCLDRR